MPAEKEVQRLDDLYALDILDTPAEERFDRITRLARRIFDVPYALVSLVDRDRQWFKSRQGLEITQTPRNLAICDHAIREASHLMVPDLTQDPRFAHNPLVTKPPHFRFYAGVVLKSIEGRPVGTLCIMDSKPRPALEKRQLALLQDLRAMVERELNEGHRLDLWRQTLVHRTLYRADGLPGEKLFSEQSQQTLTRSSEAAMVVLGVNEYALSILELSSEQQALLNRELAERVASVFRLADHIGTLGNGRYAALFVLDHNPLLKSASNRHRRYLAAKALQAEFARPIQVANRRVYPTVGVSLFPDNAQGVEQLLVQAELARPGKMTSAIRAIGFYSFDKEAQLQRSVLIETRLRQAIAENRLRMNYQPKFDLASGKVSGLEALVRWHDPDLGEISPADFVPIAERSDIIRDLTDWVLAAVCHQYAQWTAQGMDRGITIAVNLSAEDLLRPNFLQWLRALLDHTGTPASALVLEITEGSLVDNVELAAEHIREAKALGLSVHIDDFGTGYSSLSQLHRLPLDALKVDRSFVNEIGTNSSGELVTNAIISLAKSLRLSVVAEGIETDAQLTELRNLGCDSVQGFLLSRPLEAPAVTSLLTQSMSCQK
ncbi:EAL domain-containing protein [Marinobacter nauticus]